uniref:Uncharacterized protein n=1 Tax=mine drainage metagenome TaxID=410659 RepID=E6QMG3_9ZZZZ
MTVSLEAASPVWSFAAPLKITSNSYFFSLFSTTLPTAHRKVI